MARETHPFIWTISPGGYSITRTRRIDPGAPDDKERDYLTDGRPVGVHGGGAKIYQPLKEFTGLFRNFIEIGMSKERVLDFAERHGFLGPPLRVMISLGKGDEGKHVVGVGEEAFQWMVEAQAMADVVRLWDATRDGNLEYLSRHIIWNEHGVHFDSHPEAGKEMPAPPFYRTIKNIGPPGGSPGQFEPGDLVRPTLSHIQYSINEHLKNSASPKLLWHENETRLGLFVVPHGLLGALWLQLAEAVNRNAEYRECSVCGKWFEIAPGMGRSDKQFCSAYCRTKAFRQRKAETETKPTKPSVSAKPRSRLRRDGGDQARSTKRRAPKTSR